MNVIPSALEPFALAAIFSLIALAATGDDARKDLMRLYPIILVLVLFIYMLFMGVDDVDTAIAALKKIFVGE